MLGTKTDLIKAANGIFRPRVAPQVEQPTPQAPPSPYEQAISRRLALSMTPDQRLASTEAAPGASMAPTSSYQKLLSGVTRPMGGLSSKGKYGGFYSAGDLESAISGSAMRFATEVPSYLRSQAGQRYSDLESMYGKAMLGGQSTVAQRQGGGFRAFEEATQNRSPLLRDYANNVLGNWYAQNAAPAEEYLATAQQIESTPVSNLATAIASQAYGMNPDLARGKFSGLDQRMFEERRNQQYMSQFGVPYEQYKFQQDQQLGTAREMAKSQVAAIEAATGMNLSQIRDFSGLNDTAVYNALTMGDVQYEQDGEIVSSPAASVVQEALGMFNSGDEEGLNSFIENIRQSEGQSDVARLIEAIVGLQARKSSRNIGYLEDYWLNTGQ
jgi:hypothetical protein